MDNIQEQRKELRLSQEEVAQYLRVSRYTVMRWEKNVGSMPVGQYIKLQDKFKKLKEMHYGMDTN